MGADASLFVVGRREERGARGQDPHSGAVFISVGLASPCPMPFIQRAHVVAAAGLTTTTPPVAQRVNLTAAVMKRGVWQGRSRYFQTSDCP